MLDYRNPASLSGVGGGDDDKRGEAVVENVPELQLKRAFDDPRRTSSDRKVAGNLRRASKNSRP